MTGPFEIKREVHRYVYHLDLSLKYRLHPIFYVSMLKPFRDQDPRLKKVRPSSDFEVWDKTVGQISDIIG